MPRLGDITRILDDEERDALSELSWQSEFWESLWLFYLEHGDLTKAQYACLIEVMNE